MFLKQPQFTSYSLISHPALVILKLYMANETITLYHSTDKAGLEGISASGGLFGHESLAHRPAGESGGGNLTPDKDASQAFILAERGAGQWREQDGPPELFTLQFEVSSGEVKFVGETRSYGCPEYTGVHTVDARDIPDGYFDKLHAGNPAYRGTKAAAIEAEERGAIRFYVIPTEDLVRTEQIFY